MSKRHRSGPEPARGSRFQRTMKVAEILAEDPGAARVLADFGLPCQECVVQFHETLEQGCRPLGLDVERILARLKTLSRP